MNTNNKIANRSTIAEFFGTDELTTHRILMNLNFGFFKSHFGTDADMMWEAAHPFFYSNGIYRDYTSISLDFIANHFQLFSGKQFFTSAGWEYNEKINKMEYRYKSGYTNVA